MQYDRPILVNNRVRFLPTVPFTEADRRDCEYRCILIATQVGYKVGFGEKERADNASVIGSFLVRPEGFEPSRFPRRILSPLCMPFHHGRNWIIVPRQTRMSILA